MKHVFVSLALLLLGGFAQATSPAPGTGVDTVLDVTVSPVRPDVQTPTPENTWKLSILIDGTIVKSTISNGRKFSQAIGSVDRSQIGKLIDLAMNAQKGQIAGAKAGPKCTRPRTKHQITALDGAVSLQDGFNCSLLRQNTSYEAQVLLRYLSRVMFHYQMTVK